MKETTLVNLKHNNKHNNQIYSLKPSPLNYFKVNSLYKAKNHSYVEYIFITYGTYNTWSYVVVRDYLLRYKNSWILMANKTHVFPLVTSRVLSTVSKFSTYAKKAHTRSWTNLYVTIIPSKKEYFFKLLNIFIPLQCVCFSNY